MNRFARYALATALAVAGFAAAPAQAADYFAIEPAYGTSVCNEHRVLTRIVDRFAYKDATFLKRGLAIQDFSAIRLTRYEPKDEKRLIERHYCQAHANMNDNQSRTIWFLIETDMGFASIGDGVEFCVAGLDPLRAYGANCQSLQ
jgi:hypothetical protein